MGTIATLKLNLITDASGFDAGLKKATGSTQSFVSKLRSVGKLAVAGIAGVAAAVGGAVATIGPKAIEAASDFEESLSKVQVVFGDAAGAVEEFSKTTALQLGITQREALATAGTYGNLFVTMGLGQSAAAGMSTDLVTLAADLASFNNLDPSEVLDKMRAGLVGETEPLRALGINLTAAGVAAKAMEMGLADADGELSEAAKLQARFAMIMDQSATAQGDFARTSTGLANTQRVLKAVWGDALQSIGQVALPMLTNALQGLMPILTGVVLPGIQTVVGAFGTFQSMVAEGESPIAALGVVLGQFLPVDTVTAITTGLTTIVEGVQSLIAAASPYVAMAAEWIGQNIQIKDALMAIGGVILWVVGSAIAPIVASVAGMVAAFAVVVAAVAAVRAAWENDFLGIRTALQNAWAAIQPALQQLMTWLQENIPVALQTLANIWQSVLLPAIEFVVGFIRDNVLPVWAAVGEVLIAVVGKGLEALAGLWQNVLWPALQRMVKFLQDQLGPVFDWFIHQFLGPMERFFRAIGDAVQRLVSFLRDMADKISGLDLPDWLTPGSPTPLELGLLGIADAAQALSRIALPAGFAGMPATALAGAGAGPTGVGGGGLSGGLTINLYGVSDPQASADAVVRALRDRGLLPQTSYR